MNTLVSYFIILITLVSECSSWSQDATIIQTNKFSLKERMEMFDHGQMTLRTLTDNEEWNDELLSYYYNHKSEVMVEWKLPISMCLAGLGKYAESAKVATEYVGVYSNDWRGWRMLGLDSLLEGSFRESVDALTRATTLGDDYSYKPLGAAALALGRTNLLRETIVPHLLVLKDVKGTSKDERLDIALILLNYSLQTSQKDVFVKALDGLSASDILERGDLPICVEAGCKQFEDKRIKRLCNELEELSKKKSKHETEH